MTKCLTIGWLLEEEGCFSISSRGSLINTEDQPIMFQLIKLILYLLYRHPDATSLIFLFQRLQFIDHLLLQNIKFNVKNSHAFAFRKTFGYVGKCVKTLVAFFCILYCFLLLLLYLSSTFRQQLVFLNYGE